MIDYKAPEEPEYETLEITEFAGLNLSSDPTQIGINESPDMLNVFVDLLGALEKRTGYKKAIPISLGSSGINGIAVLGTNLIVAHGGNIYKFSLSELF